MTPPENTTTQSAHLIMMECNECDDGRVYGHDNEWDTCTHCVNGKIEHMMWMIEQPEEVDELNYYTTLMLCSIDTKCYICDNLADGPEDYFEEMYVALNEEQYLDHLSPFQSGSTVPTPDGDRIAGKVSLRQIKDLPILFEAQIDELSYLEIIKDKDKFENQYVGMAPSNPAKESNE